MFCKIKWLRNFHMFPFKINLTAANSEGWHRFSGKVHLPISLGFFPQPGSLLPFHQEGKSLEKVPQLFSGIHVGRGNRLANTITLHTALSISSCTGGQLPSMNPLAAFASSTLSNQESRWKRDLRRKRRLAVGPTHAITAVNIPSTQKRRLIEI